LALAAFHANRGCYPAQLAELVPGYVVELPKDMFNGATLGYRRKGEGYLLGSVGVNGKSDSGKTYEDRKDNEDWDDLVVRMPR
jgi:hypothetical protein